MPPPNMPGYTGHGMPHQSFSQIRAYMCRPQPVTLTIQLRDHEHRGLQAPLLKQLQKTCNSNRYCIPLKLRMATRSCSIIPSATNAAKHACTHEQGSGQPDLDISLDQHAATQTMLPSEHHHSRRTCTQSATKCGSLHRLWFAALAHCQRTTSDNVDGTTNQYSMTVSTFAHRYRPVFQQRP